MGWAMDQTTANQINELTDNPTDLFMPYLANVTNFVVENRPVKVDKKLLGIGLMYYKCIKKKRRV